MHEPVMEGAEPGAVVERCRTAERPPVDVVKIDAATPALRERALPTLFEPRGPALRGRPLPGRPADVEHLALRTEDDWKDFGVTGEPAGGLRGGHNPGLERNPLRAQPVFEDFRGDRHHHADRRAGEARLV